MPYRDWLLTSAQTRLSFAAGLLGCRTLLPREMSDGSPFKQFYKRSLLSVIEIAHKRQRNDIAASALIKYCSYFSDNNAVRLLAMRVVSQRLGSLLYTSITSNSNNLLNNARFLDTIQSLIYTLRASIRRGALTDAECIYASHVCTLFTQIIYSGITSAPEHRRHSEPGRITRRPRALGGDNSLPYGQWVEDALAPIYESKDLLQALHLDQTHLAGNFAESNRPGLDDSPLTNFSYNAFSLTVDRRGRKIARYSPVTSELSGTVIIFLGNVGIETLDLTPLGAAQRLVFLSTGKQTTAEISEHAKKVLGKEIGIRSLNIYTDVTKTYSNKDRYCSDFADDISESIAIYLENAFKEADIAYINDVRDDIKLRFSDQLYRKIQANYSLLDVIREEDASAIIFADIVSGTMISLASDTKAAKVLIPTASEAYERLSQAINQTFNFPLQDVGQFLRRASRVRMESAERAINRTLELALRESFGPQPRVLVLCNGRSKSYRQAIDHLASVAKSEYIIDVIDFDVAGGLSAEHSAEVSINILNCLKGNHVLRVDPTVAYISTFLLRNALKSLEFSGIPAISLVGDLAPAATRVVARDLYGMIALRNEIRKFFDLRRYMAVVASPGRVPEIRIGVREAQRQRIPTIDMQTVYVSTASRYRPPITDYVTAIDTIAHEHYRTHCGLADSKLYLAGSINLDLQIIEARKVDNAKVRRDLFGSNTDDGPIITFAAQPVGAEIALKTLQALCDLCKTEVGSRLIIKLHPGQHDGVMSEYHSYLASRLGVDEEGKRWLVVRDLPIFDVVVAADLLVTFFSNVGILAAALDIPVLTISIPEIGTPIPLGRMGVSQEVEGPEKLVSTAQAMIAECRSSPQGKIFNRYLHENPHISDPCTAERVLNLISEIITANPSSSTSETTAIH